MKYSEFLQLEDLLLDNNLTFEDIKENPEVLNEVAGIATILGTIAGFLGLGLLFRKKLVSLGVKRIYLHQLVKTAKKFKKDSLDGLQKAIKPYVEAKNKIKEEEGVISWKDLSKEKKAEIYTLERRIEDILSRYISNVSDLKAEEVKKKIEGSKKLSESHKFALKYTWETLSTEVITTLLSDLLKSKIIETPYIINNIQDNLKEKVLKGEKEIKSSWQKVKDHFKEREEEGPKIGDKYIIKHQKLGGEKEGEITSISDDEIKIKTKNDKNQEMIIKISPDNFKKLQKKKIEKEPKKEIEKEGELIGGEI